MADRLRFKFVRTGKLVQYGEVAVDVADASDPTVIADKLNERTFAEYLVQTLDVDDDEWRFVPIDDTAPEEGITVV